MYNADFLMHYPCCSVNAVVNPSDVCWMCGLHTGVKYVEIQEKLPKAKWPPRQNNLTWMGFKSASLEMIKCLHP